MRVVMIAIAVLLLIVAILLAAMLLKKPGTEGTDALASPSVSATDTPSTTASPSESATLSAAPTTTTTTTTTQPPAGPTFASFSAPSSAGCPDESSNVTITISWSSSNATSAWIGVATSNAKAEPYDSVPTSGSYDIGFPCSNSHQVYTVTLEDADGHLTSKSKDIQR
jgi:hypothetical protein